MKKHLAMAMLPVAALFWLCWQAPRLLVLASNQLFPIIQTQVVSITKEFFSKQEKSEYSIDLSKMGEGFKKPEICDTYICESQLEIRVIRKDIPYDPAEISPEKFFQIVDMGPLERADGIIKGMERDAAFLAQTVLMYRGLLDTKPTGSWLHQSEKALARLEYLKGYAMTPAQAKEEILALAG
ncbi:MAG: hypothetical protein Q8P95_02205, partial [bacterium]|nr:hypothetical protein [bacterium]